MLYVNIIFGSILIWCFLIALKKILSDIIPKKSIMENILEEHYTHEKQTKQGIHFTADKSLDLSIIHILAEDIDTELTFLEEIVDVYSEYSIELIIIIPHGYDSNDIEYFQDEFTFENYRMYISDISNNNGFIQGMIRSEGMMILNSAYYDEEIPNLPLDLNEKFIVLKEPSSCNLIKVITKTASNILLSKIRYQSSLFYYDVLYQSKQNQIRIIDEGFTEDQSALDFVISLILHLYLRFINKYYPTKTKYKEE